MSETPLRCARCHVYVADQAADMLRRDEEHRFVCVDVGRCDDRVARRQFLLQISPRTAVRTARGTAST